MTALQWDQIGSRNFETGVDRVALYLDDGLVVPWSGVTDISENSTYSTEEVYFDGRKINDIVRSKSFSGRIRALTYPDEFLPYEGVAVDSAGLLFAEQRPRRFSMSYRTLIGNDTEGLDAGYRIHILYDLTAVPATRNFRTLGLEVDPVDFEWDITGIPKNVAGYEPTAHVIIDTRKMAPWLVADIEEILYGSADADPFLPSLESFSTFIRGYDRIVVFDNGDGTWTVSTDREGAITEVGGVITIVDAQTANETADQYDISSTDKEALWQP